MKLFDLFNKEERKNKAVQRAKMISLCYKCYNAFLRKHGGSVKIINNGLHGASLHGIHDSDEKWTGDIVTIIENKDDGFDLIISYMNNIGSHDDSMIFSIKELDNDYEIVLTTVKDVHPLPFKIVKEKVIDFFQQFGMIYERAVKEKVYNLKNDHYSTLVNDLIVSYSSIKLVPLHEIGI